MSSVIKSSLEEWLADLKRDGDAEVIIEDPEGHLLEIISVYPHVNGSIRILTELWNPE